MLLFNIGINPIINEVEVRRCGGIMIGSRLISCMAYADDLVFFAESPDKLQNVVDIASNAVKAIGMSFRASKCAILDIPLQKEHTHNNRSCRHTTSRS
jgi:hypothetical protein